MAADKLFKEIFFQQGSHSADWTGADGESVAAWTALFFDYEQWKLNNESNNQQTECIHVNNRQIEHGILEQQAVATWSQQECTSATQRD
jgi:hypothetical protein